MTTILKRTDNYLASPANNPAIMRMLLAELASELRLSIWRINRLQGELRALQQQGLPTYSKSVPKLATGPCSRSWLDIWRDLDGPGPPRWKG